MFLPYSDVKNYLIVSKDSILTLGKTENLTRVKTLFVFIILQYITTGLIKISILILYRRTFITKNFQAAVWIVGAFVIANFIGGLVSVFQYCKPIAHFWDPLGVPGHCSNLPLTITMDSMLLLITDLIIYMMPMPVIWKLRMTTRRKIEITLMFLVGLL